LSDEIATRELIVKPRARGYVHRPIVVVRDGIGMTEEGEVITDLFLFAIGADSHIFVTFDPADILNTMKAGHAPDFNYQIINAREADVPDGMAAFMSSTRVTRFGWAPHRRTQGQAQQGTRPCTSSGASRT
jgi:hypothetical protein